MSRKKKKVYNKGSQASELKRLLTSLIKTLKASGQLSKEDLLGLFEEETLPLEIFTKRLGILEAAVKYLHENDLSFSLIAKKINRNPRTVWACFDSARRKHPARFMIKHPESSIPIKVLADRKHSPLEAVCKELSYLPYSKIAKLIHRDQRNVWNSVNKHAPRN